jgi:PIN domain nuclease of toxin-antitoxin system
VTRVLLDTHAFLWWVNDDDQLTSRARRTITGASEAFLSIASCWEMAIKASIGRLDLPKRVEHFVPEQLAANNFGLLHIDLTDVARVETLPFHHRDPFDRLLAAQALNDELVVVSRDPTFRKYGLRRVW